VLRVDERRHPAQFLRFRDHLQRNVVLPDDSGPKISTTRREARRRFESEIDADGARGDEVIGLDAPFWPRRMIEPFPNCFSI